MSERTNLDFNEVASLFEMRGDLVNAYPYGSGHINDTFCAHYDQAGQRIRYIHQRINTRILKDPAALMENIERVTRHSLNRLRAMKHPEACRRTLTLIPGTDGLPFAIDQHGNYWRTYQFIERARTYDVIENEGQARAAARAFALFQKYTADIPGKRLHETIPLFHDTRDRLRKFRESLSRDTQGRAKDVATEVAFVEERASDCGKVVSLLEKGEIPERITHNDTKLNNVMIDDVSGEGVCVIDLDTVMPGSALYDFGDMVRTATPSGAEDAKDFEQIEMQMQMFAALVEGYIAGAGDVLTEREIELLAFSGKLLPLECGIRFLTDYLDGDVYFKAKHEAHNLDRCRTQFALVASVEKQLPEMNAKVEQVWKAFGEVQ